MQVFPHFYNRNTTWYPENRHGIPDKSTNEIGQGLSEQPAHIISGRSGEPFSRG